jgi:hypothetical protein
MAAVNAGVVPQHMSALQLANRVRLARAELKRQVRARQIPAADVVRDVPWEAQTMAIGELLVAQHRWGRTRMLRFLARLAVGENKQLGSLTERQRRVLIDALNGAPFYG